MKGILIECSHSTNRNYAPALGRARVEHDLSGPHGSALRCDDSGAFSRA